MNTENKKNNRIARLTQIQYHLHRNRKGLTTRELAALCGTAVRTIQRDLLFLQTDLQVPIISKGSDRYSILKDYILLPVAYNLYETLILFLSARLMVRQTDQDNPHTRTALYKLLSVLPAPLAAQLKESIEAISRKPANPDETDVFEKVTIAWSTRKRLRIKYNSYHSGQTREWLVNPYFVDMTGVGFSIYLIGHAESSERVGINTFKLNRITEIEILDEDFEYPLDLKMDKLLASAWGIIFGEETSVKLRFSPSVTRRVKESLWHPSLTLEDLPDGGCIANLRVASTLEMTPWIRGWGPDVEVLEPLELRDQMREWSKQLAEMYGVEK